MSKVKRNYKRKSNEEKREELERLTEGMENRITSYFHSVENIKEYLEFMGKFHTYSIRNAVMIENQFTGANAVGSFAFWRSKGFRVNKGEKGIKILVPKPVSYFKRGDKEVLVRYASKEEKKQIENKIIPIQKKIFFEIGHTFDVSQTNATAEDLPEIFPNRWMEGNVEDYELLYSSLEEVAEKNNVKIVEPKHELGVAKGVSYSHRITKEKEVALNPRNSQIQNVKTLIHELAHAVLHTVDKEDEYTSQEKEFQAEMVAYAVASFFGVDTSDYSLLYLSSWTKGKELKQQKKLLEEVKDTAHQFIEIMEAFLLLENKASQDDDLVS